MTSVPAPRPSPSPPSSTTPWASAAAASPRRPSSPTALSTQRPPQRSRRLRRHTASLTGSIRPHALPRCGQGASTPPEPVRTLLTSLTSPPVPVAAVLQWRRRTLGGRPGGVRMRARWPAVPTARDGSFYCAGSSSYCARWPAVPTPRLRSSEVSGSLRIVADGIRRLDPPSGSAWTVSETCAG